MDSSSNFSDVDNFGYNESDIEDYPYINLDCIKIVNETHYYYDPCCDKLCCDTGGMQEQIPEALTQNFTIYVLFKILCPLVSTIGIIGILLTILVLSRKSMCTSTNCYLTALSAADLGFLVILCTRFFEPHFTGLNRYPFIIYYEYAMIFQVMFIIASVWMTVFLALERYIAIVHPYRASSFCTVRRARIAIVIIFLVSLLLRVPFFFENKIMTSFTSDCTELLHLQKTNLYENKVYKDITRWGINCVISAVVPFCILAILNIRLIWEIRKSTTYIKTSLVLDRKLQNVLTKEQRKITIMLVSIIIIFFICEAPYVCVNVYMSLYPSITQEIHLVWTVAILLCTCKSICNFILYCWFSEKFWETLKWKIIFKLMCCKNKYAYESPSNSRRFSHQNGHHDVSSAVVVRHNSKKQSTCPEDVV